MRKGPTIFLQMVIVLISIGSLALLLWEPNLEGRNAHATLFQVYFNDPFLAYAYTASVAYFVALYQTFNVLGSIGRGEAFSQRPVKALRTIKVCAMSLVGFLVGAEAYFFIARRDKDDTAGGVMMGLVIILVSTVAAAAAAVFERTLQSAVDLKSQKDLTV